jgi:hydroxymethylbilane synthase
MALLKIGSRGSKLALWQSEHISSLLRGMGHQVTIEKIVTTGDRITDAPFARVGTKGMFLKEIEEALLEERVDIAVHSLKDVPTELPEGLVIAAIPQREDARDAFLSVQYATLLQLPQGAKVGTSSLRRQAQLRALRPDLDVQELRGNVDTRIRKLETGEYDAILLAAAGVNRLQLTQHVKERLGLDVMCPAPGQGALAIEVRAADERTYNIIRELDHAQTRAAVECERAALQKLGGGCHLPVGAHALHQNGGLNLHVVVARPDGKQVLRMQRIGTVPKLLGESLAEVILKAGAAEILAELESEQTGKGN